MAKHFSWVFKPMHFFILVFALSFSLNADDVYILEKSINVLPEAKNFRKDEVIPPSTGGRLSVLRRVAEQDPKWWPGGIAIEIVSVNGQEQRPVRVVYIAKKWFERATRSGDVAQLPNPQAIQHQVLSALTPILPACEIEVNEPVLPSTLSPAPTNPDTYSILADLVKVTNSPRTCQNVLRRWYRANSMWKDYSREQRAQMIVDRANSIATKIRLDGLSNTCARALGVSSSQEKSQLRSFMENNLSEQQKNQISVVTYEEHCRRYQRSHGISAINTSYFREVASNPDTVHPQFDASLAVCIIKREVSSTSFDPHSMNYSFCEQRGRSGRPRSTAHGLGQFTQTTFLSLREAGLMPLSSASNTTNRTENRTIFREMSTDPDMQIESIFHYINYLMKAPSSARIRRMHDQVYNDRFEDWEKAVISYDQDRASAYISGVHSCRRCMANAAGDRSAEATCLSR